MSQSDDLEAMFELETFEAGGRSLWVGMHDVRAGCPNYVDDQHSWCG
ncbi:hypothetical protein [Corynebacterium casei]|nr:hypothetical protein [Corynebacterium casei]